MTSTSGCRGTWIHVFPVPDPSKQVNPGAGVAAILYIMSGCLVTLLLVSGLKGYPCMEDQIATQFDFSE
jgi:hypothetical protein